MTAPIVFGPQTCGSTGPDGGADPATVVRWTGPVTLVLTLTPPSSAQVPQFTREWRPGAVAPQGHRRAGPVPGTPVAVAGTGGLAEIIEHGVTSVRFTPQDPESLAAAVGSVLADHDYARRLARHGRRRVRDEFAWPEIAAATAAVYTAAGADGGVTRAAESMLALARA